MTIKRRNRNRFNFFSFTYLNISSLMLLKQPLLLFFFFPAVIMDLKQDFWSIRGHIIYFAFGLLCRNVKKHRVRLIPVAIGTTKQLVTVWTPTNKKKTEIIFSTEKSSFLKK